MPIRSGTVTTNEIEIEEPNKTKRASKRSILIFCSPLYCFGSNKQHRSVEKNSTYFLFIRILRA